MNEKMVTLPICGGRAWLRTRLSDGRMDDLESSRTARLPQGGLAAILQAIETGKLTRESSAQEEAEYLLARGFTGADIRKAAKEADRVAVRLICKRWAGVYGPESEAELEFPDGLPDLYPEDFDALLLECWRAVNEGRADPNAGTAPSGPTSWPEADAEAVAVNGNGSRETSKMPSGSTS